MAEIPDLDPTHPRDEGMREKTPDAMQIEGAKLLADKVRDDLRRQGFSDRQIDDWATTYIAEEGSGDVPAFLAWVEERQGG